jgi:hypothetical protein
MNEPREGLTGPSIPCSVHMLGRAAKGCLSENLTLVEGNAVVGPVVPFAQTLALQTIAQGL